MKNFSFLVILLGCLSSYSQEPVLPLIPASLSGSPAPKTKLIVRKDGKAQIAVQAAAYAQSSAAQAIIHNNLTGRNAINTHPAASISFTPSGSLTATTTQQALVELDKEKEPAVTKGSLTETVPGLEFSDNRQLIGGSATLSVTSGYLIPTTESATSWDNKAPASGSGSYIQNQNSAIQPGNFSIAGSGKFGNSVTIWGNAIMGMISASNHLALKSAGAMGFQSTAGFSFRDNLTNLAELNSDRATFSTPIEAPTIKLTSNAAAGYFWKCTDPDGSGAWSPVELPNNYATALGFTDGTLSLSRSGLADLSVSLDGRYSPLAHTHDYAPNSGSGSYIQNQNSSAQTGKTGEVDQVIPE